MNKIKIVNDLIDNLKLDDSIEVTFQEKNEITYVNGIKIKVIEDTNLEIEYIANKETKMNIQIEVLKKVKLHLLEYRHGSKVKIQYKYDLGEDSLVVINKFSQNNGVKELDIVNLNGRGSTFNYKFKTIANKQEQYDLMIYHNDSYTTSNILNHGLNDQEGSIIINITSMIPENKIGCVANQNNRIINLSDNKCEINPNLLIEENDVEANHSAHIGRFSNDEMFYLQSRGFPKEVALKLLIKGFLLSELDINDEQKSLLTHSIDSYWR